MNTAPVPLVHLYLLNLPVNITLPLACLNKNEKCFAYTTLVELRSLEYPSLSPFRSLEFIYVFICAEMR